MKLSLRWLSRHVDLSGIEPKQILADLTMSTAEIDGLIRFGEGLEPFVTGHVRKRDKHPDADKLSVCEVDLRPGGRFRYVWSRPGRTDMGMGGTFVTIEPPERIVHRELFDADWTGGETTVTTVLDERDGITRMTLTVEYSSRAARDGALATGMTSGMDTSYARLDGMLAV